MKSLNEYLVESKKSTFGYRIKIAGELDEEKMEKLKQDLGKFVVKKLSDVKTTPIMKEAFGFPGLENVEVHSMDLETEYPASCEQILELARLSGFDPNRVRVLDKSFDEYWSDNMEQRDAPKKKANLETTYPEPTPEQKKAKKDYAKSYVDAVKDMEKSKFKIAGGKPPKAKYSTDEK